MIGPALTPRIKQRDNLPRHRIDAGQVRAFAEIATMTGKGQIAGIIAATMLAGYYVLDVVLKRATFLRKETILATVSGSTSDECPRRRLHRLGRFGKLSSGL
jgi:hypothetical protein